MNATPDVPLYPNYYEHNMGKLTNAELNKRYTEQLNSDPRPHWRDAVRHPHHKPKNIVLTRISRLIKPGWRLKNGKEVRRSGERYSLNDHLLP